MKPFICIRCVVVLGAMIAVSSLLYGAPSQIGGMIVVLSPIQLSWGPAPPQLAKGIQLAVLAGDPSKTGPYTVRLKWPSGSKIGPHWHPADVNVTVMSGNFGIGVGDKFEKSEGKLVKPGGYFLEPEGMHHYAWADGVTVIQLHGEGPLVINYVNPSDDPSAAH
jgi:ChrR-like protein with cupin domain